MGFGIFVLQNWLMHKYYTESNAFYTYSLLLVQTRISIEHELKISKDGVVIREFETKLDFYALNDARVIYYIQPSLVGTR